MIGIYKITNIITEKVYIGSTLNINKRWNKHKSQLRNNTHHSIKLQNSVNKHGIENFIFEVIEECSKNLLIEREQYWIDILDSYNNGYNSRPIASNMLGMKLSEETKQKISNKNKCRILTEEHKRKLSESNKGKQNTLGYKHSEETKNKISERNKNNKNALGIKHSEETKKKMSEAKKGTKRKSPSKETRLKISLALKLRHQKQTL